MSLKKLSGVAAMVALTILLSACNIGATPAPTQDVGLIYTQAAQLVATQFAMQQTQTALAIPPTPLPSPTAPAIPTFPAAAPFGASTPFGGASTPFVISTQPGGFLPTSTIMALATAAGPVCDHALFISDDSIPDGTVMKPGYSFDKTWTIKNTGTCTWDEGYSFVYLGGTLGGYNIKIRYKNDFVEPDKTVSYSVHLNASLVPNTYQDCWSMMNDKGEYFQDSPLACVKIVVEK